MKITAEIRIRASQKQGEPRPPSTLMYVSTCAENPKLAILTMPHVPNSSGWKEFEVEIVQLASALAAIKETNETVP